METLITYAIPAMILGFFLLRYHHSKKKRDLAALESAEKGKLHSSGPQSQHPHVDMTYCIGCASCTMICPEGDVLAMLGGKAVIVNGHKCIGHSLCAEACPVGAITMVMARPSVGADNPYLTPEYETTIPNMFIVGELGGLALIKNAVNQGRDSVDTITKRLAGMPRPAGDVYDIVVIGSGPAGISAGLRAAENKLNYTILEQDETVGGTVAKYPRQKLVMTSPWQFPTYGKFKKTELSKEDLIAFWESVMKRADFKARTGEKVTDITREEDGTFTLISSKGQYRARAVVLALGKTGSPRKLGVKGEQLSKVMYRLIEADHYVNKQILVVGGGDSAVEAAMGLGKQVGNKVTLSYRKETFARIKERNTQRVQECVKDGTLKVVFNSIPVEIKEKSVMLEVNGAVEEIPNDFVWVFAGGEPPTAFLKKIGIGFGVQDITSEVSSEAKQAKKDLTEIKRAVREEAVPAGAEMAPSKAEAPRKPETVEAMPSKPAEIQATPKEREAAPAQALPATLGATARGAAFKGPEKQIVRRRLGVPGEDLPKVAYALNDAQKYMGKDIVIVGGSESSVRAALALSYMGRNRVTLIYRGDSLLTTDQNRKLLAKLSSENQIRILKNAVLVEITPDSTVVDVGGKVEDIPSDTVFILVAESYVQGVRPSEPAESVVSPR